MSSASASKDGKEFFSQLTASQPKPSELSGHRRERYEEGTVDASLLSGNSQANLMDVKPHNDAASANVPTKTGISAKECTGSVRTGHMWKRTYQQGNEFPTPVGRCLRCNVHCNHNPMDRNCPGNKSLKFEDDKVTFTITMDNSDE